MVRFNQAQATFAQQVGARPPKRILMAINEVKWHLGQELVIPPNGIHLEIWPSHSPELQPAEQSR